MSGTCSPGYNAAKAFMRANSEQEADKLFGLHTGVAADPGHHGHFSHGHTVSAYRSEARRSLPVAECGRVVTNSTEPGTLNFASRSAQWVRTCSSVSVAPSRRIRTALTRSP